MVTIIGRRLLSRDNYPTILFVRTLYFLPLMVFWVVACGTMGDATPTGVAVAETQMTVRQTEQPPAARVIPTEPVEEVEAPATATLTPVPGPTLTPTTSPTESPTATRTATPSVTNTATPLLPATPTLPSTLATVRQTANLRAGPGTAFAIVGEIKAGQKVLVLARNPAGNWLRLDLGDAEQIWVAAHLLDLTTGQALPIAADIPLLPPSPTPGDVVVLRQESRSIPTYPWQRYTTVEFDEDTQWSYRRFDRQAYQASDPQSQSLNYVAMILENRWLKLSLLPDIGGRLYEMVFKPTGSNELYRNGVIKPSPWGPDVMGNGWMAAGGIEWGLPVVEHGYAWGDSWGYITEPDYPAASITVFDMAQDTLHLYVDVGLLPDSAAFTLDLHLENLSEQPIKGSYWTNAMLAPGPANTVGPETHFILPEAEMMVHSTGDPSLPTEGGIFSWPVYNGRALNRLGNWHQWLGFFASPQAQTGWAAVYDTSVDEGVVRIFPPQRSPGLKVFGLGWHAAIDAANYTDDGSAYVELQGGITPNFSVDYPFAPQELIEWQEIWYPVAGIGGVSWADAQGAVHITAGDTSLRFRLFSVMSRQGELIVEASGSEIFRQIVQTDPANPLDLNLPLAESPISFRFLADERQAWRMTGIVPGSR